MVIASSKSTAILIVFSSTTVIFAMAWAPLFLSNFHSEYFRTLFKVLPGESLGIHRFKLVSQGNRIVVIDQKQGFAGLQLIKGFKDHLVLQVRRIFRHLDCRCKLLHEHLPQTSNQF